MNQTGVVFTCAHTDPKVSNRRFELLAKFLYDLRPEFVVDLGDGADMRSLNSFDTSRPAKLANTAPYEDDIDTYNEAQEILREPFRRNKKKRPVWFGFEGNHENRIKKAVANDPRLAGSRFGISFEHLNTSKWFDEYFEYENGAPAIQQINGVDYAHFVSSGNYGTAMSGEHHAYNLLKKRLRSTTVGHSHKRSLFFRDDAKAIGLVAGCFKGAPEDWAGQANKDWWSGVIVKHNHNEYGYYEPEFVSLARLEQEYGQ